MNRLTWLACTLMCGLLVTSLFLWSPNRTQANADDGTVVSASSSSAGELHVPAARDDDAATQRKTRKRRKTRSAKKEEEEREKEGKGEEGEEHERAFHFSKKQSGKVPAGWSVAKTGEGEGSEWKVVADRTAPSGTGFVLAQTAKSPSRVFNLCVVDELKKRDVEVEVCFKAVHGKIDQGGGIVWRYRDADNYYVARMNPLEDNYRFYKVVRGKRTQLGTKEGIKVAAGTWHTLEIECRGNKIVCELDDKVILKAQDDTFQKAGKVGLWSKADAQTYFDNFKVE